MLTRIKSWTLLFIVLPLSVAAQDLSSIFFPKNSVQYIGQVGTNGKEHNGMGVLRLKNGIYAGDFSRNQFHGIGIQIMSVNKNIDKCGDASIYVGKWFRNKKNGIGRLYNSKGNLIYNGKFVDDKPTEQFLSVADSSMRFSIVEIDGELYIGETVDNIPHGFGMFVDDEDDILSYTFCSVKMGMKHGLSIMLLPPYNWAVFNIENELYYPIDSYAAQQQLASEYKANRDKERQELFNTFSDLLSYGSTIVSNIQDIGKSLKNSDLSDNQNSGYSDQPSRSSNGNSNKYNLSEQGHYNSDKATYRKYDSILAAVFAGNRPASQSEIEQWQQKMRNLRKKWEDKGKSFPHSINEDK